MGHFATTINLIGVRGHLRHRHGDRIYLCVVHRSAQGPISDPRDFAHYKNQLPHYGHVAHRGGTVLGAVTGVLLPSVPNPVQGSDRRPNRYGLDLCCQRLLQRVGYGS